MKATLKFAGTYGGDSQKELKTVVSDVIDKAAAEAFMIWMGDNFTEMKPSLVSVNDAIRYAVTFDPADELNADERCEVTFKDTATGKTSTQSFPVPLDVDIEPTADGDRLTSEKLIQLTAQFNLLTGKVFVGIVGKVIKKR